MKLILWWEKMCNRIKKFQQLNGRISYIRFKNNKQADITRINAYALIEEATEEDTL